MSADEVTEHQSTVILLPSDFDINSVEALHKTAMESIDQKKPIVIDTTELSAVDTCGCQWLLWLVQLCNLRQIKIEMGDVPPALQEALTILGLAEKFNKVCHQE